MQILKVHRAVGCIQHCMLATQRFDSNGRNFWNDSAEDDKASHSTRYSRKPSHRLVARTVSLIRMTFASCSREAGWRFARWTGSSGMDCIVRRKGRLGHEPGYGAVKATDPRDDPRARRYHDGHNSAAFAHRQLSGLAGWGPEWIGWIGVDPDPTYGGPAVYVAYLPGVYLKYRRSHICPLAPPLIRRPRGAAARGVM